MLQVFTHPPDEQYSLLCKRPEIDHVLLSTGIQTIFNEIQRNGDVALLKYTEKFDGVKLTSFLYHTKNIDPESLPISDELKHSISNAYKNIHAFHMAQKSDSLIVETMPGIVCSQQTLPISRVGIYIPGGTAPLFSTVLMLSIPAQLAGCEEIILCTPPTSSGDIHPAILYAALICGIKEIRLVGGAQAIAALTFGTTEIPAVDKIFGPGNQYVTAAKQLAQNYGVAIDMPAGPSEVLIFADNTATPSFLAADLLAQAEHGSDSQVILVTENEELVTLTLIEIEKQLIQLPRRELAKQALSHSKAIVVENPVKAFEFVNIYAPEHLIIASDEAEKYVPFIRNAGSVFLGNFCPESAGDYASGTNHTLPTNGWARSYSGVNLDAFCKKITFQSITEDGLKGLANTIITMAEAEELQAHANAVKVRLNQWTK